MTRSELQFNFDSFLRYGEYWTQKNSIYAGVYIFINSLNIQISTKLKLKLCLLVSFSFRSCPTHWQDNKIIMMLRLFSKGRILTIQRFSGTKIQPRIPAFLKLKLKLKIKYNKNNYREIIISFFLKKKRIKIRWDQGLLQSHVKKLKWAK